MFQLQIVDSAREPIIYIPATDFGKEIYLESHNTKFVQKWDNNKGWLSIPTFVMWETFSLEDILYIKEK